MGKYFGTDGFRGEANVKLTADHAFRVGRYLLPWLVLKAQASVQDAFKKLTDDGVYPEGLYQ